MDLIGNNASERTCFSDSRADQADALIDAGEKRSIIPAVPGHDLSKLWEEHTADEFIRRDTEATLATMTEDAYVNHIPVMTSGYGRPALRHFYAHQFIPLTPPDASLTPVSRTVGEDQLVDEMIILPEQPYHSPGLL